MLQWSLKDHVENVEVQVVCAKCGLPNHGEDERATTEMVRTRRAQRGGFGGETRNTVASEKGWADRVGEDRDPRSRQRRTRSTGNIRGDQSMWRTPLEQDINARRRKKIPVFCHNLAYSQLLLN